MTHAHRHILPVLAGLALLGLPHAASAGITAAGISCHDGGGYRVVQRERANDVGSDFIVKRWPKPNEANAPCTFTARSGDLRVPASAKDGNAWSFLALSGDRMALDDGTAAQNRSLVVVDLRTGKVVGSFETFETARVEGGVAYVTIAGAKGTRAACPGMKPDEVAHARLISETAIDLATLKATPSTATRCVYEE